MVKGSYHGSSNNNIKKNIQVLKRLMLVRDNAIKKYCGWEANSAVI